MNIKKSAKMVNEIVVGKYHVYVVEAMLFTFSVSVMGMYIFSQKTDFTEMEHGLWAAIFGLCMIVCALLYTRWVRDYRRQA